MLVLHVDDSFNREQVNDGQAYGVRVSGNGEGIKENLSVKMIIMVVGRVQ